MKSNKESQVSAFISATTKDLLERRVRASGVKKGHLFEEALLHHLRALEELPAEIIVRPRIVVSLESGRKLVDRIASKEKPTRELRDLMGGDGD